MNKHLEKAREKAEEVINYSSYRTKSLLYCQACGLYEKAVPEVVKEERERIKGIVENIRNEYCIETHGIDETIYKSGISFGLKELLNQSRIIRGEIR